MTRLKVVKLTFFAVMIVGNSLDSSAKDVTYYYTSPTGSVLATTDAAGNVTSVADNTPFGEVVMGRRLMAPDMRVM